jgi:NADPH:quinone reductase-like Zn-dependent oxidoreductase
VCINVDLLHREESSALQACIGAIVGVDFAGTIVEIGPSVDRSKWKVGDRVASFIAGGMSPHSLSQTV